MNFTVSNRLKKLPPYLFAEIDDEKNKLLEQGRKILDLGIGDPDLPTPEPIIAAAAGALHNSKNHCYPSYKGSLKFRKTVSAWYKNRFNVELNPENEIISLIGSKEGIGHLPLAFLNTGDVALIPDPSYPVYSTGTMFAGGVSYKMPLLEKNNFLPDFESLSADILEKAKLIYLNYPNNPTSAVADYSFYEKAIFYARKYNIIIASDQAYSEIYYKNPPISILSLPGAKDVAIELNSLSKSFNMTGWRIGMAVGNKRLVEGLGKIKTNLDSGAFGAVQDAACYALNNYEQLSNPIRKIYTSRRAKLAEALRKGGFNFKVPEATFYFWIKTPEGRSSKEFAKALLVDKGIVVTPGVGFGESGEGYFRISMTADEKTLSEAAKTIASI
ncbi:MAG TPA: aminotransferase class I/II-fold pyridoxal phosphate-dependent enzyme [Deltaproteobacteria bacterium]|nr:aminotransferase class I/II-fold pyridoxal phosphate-dependent enzyme [Deltaproteobacteria bacterium]